MAFDGVMEMDGWMEWNTYVHALKKKKPKTLSCLFLS